MHSRNNLILGISFSAFGLLTVLNMAGVGNFSQNEITALSLMLFGIPTVYYSFENSLRGNLIAGVAAFLTGVILFVKDNFEIFENRGMILSSILFISGAILLFLYIENPAEKIFALSGLMLVLFGYLASTVLKNFVMLGLANRLAYYLEDFWPVILMVLGISILLNRKR